MKKKNFFKLLTVGVLSLALGFASCNYVKETEFQDLCKRVDATELSIKEIQAALSGMSYVKSVVSGPESGQITVTDKNDAKTIITIGGGVGTTPTGMLIVKDGEWYIDNVATGMKVNEMMPRIVATPAPGHWEFPVLIDNKFVWTIIPNSEIAEAAEGATKEELAALADELENVNTELASVKERLETLGAGNNSSYAVHNPETDQWTLWIPNNAAGGELAQIVLPSSGTVLSPIDLVNLDFIPELFFNGEPAVDFWWFWGRNNLEGKQIDNADAILARQYLNSAIPPSHWTPYGGSWHNLNSRVGEPDAQDWDTEEFKILWEPAITVGETKVPVDGLSSTEKLQYRYSPSEALVGQADINSFAWDFVNRYAEFMTRATGDSNDLLTIVGGPTLDTKGSLYLDVVAKRSASKRSKAEEPTIDDLLAPYIEDDKYAVDIVALRATETEETLSEYTQVLFEDNRAYIGDPLKLLTAGNITNAGKPYLPSEVGPDFAALPGKLSDVKSKADKFRWDYFVDVMALKYTRYADYDHAVYLPVRVGSGSQPSPEQTFNLKDYVFASAWDAGYDWRTTTAYNPAMIRTNDTSKDAGIKTANDQRSLLSDLNVSDYEYRFEEVTYYSREMFDPQDVNDPTSQSKYVTLELDKGTYSTTGKVSFGEPGTGISYGAALIGRTPIFKVELWKKNAAATDRPLARHFIKFKILDYIAEVEPIVVPNVEIPYLDLYNYDTEGLTPATTPKPGVPNTWTRWMLNGGALTPYLNNNYTDEERQAVAPDTSATIEGKYKDPAYVSELVVKWEDWNEYVYNKLGITHDQFTTNYYADQPILTYEGGYVDASGNVVISDEGNILDNHYKTVKDAATDEERALYPESGLLPDKGVVFYDVDVDNPGTGTVMYGVKVHPQTRFGAHTWTVTIRPKNANSIYKPIVIKYNFNITKPAQPELVQAYAANDRIYTVNGKMFGLSANQKFKMAATLWEAFNTNPQSQAFLSDVVDMIVPITAASNPFIEDEKGNPVVTPITGYQLHSFAYSFSGYTAANDNDAQAAMPSPYETTYTNSPVNDVTFKTPVPFAWADETKADPKTSTLYDWVGHYQKWHNEQTDVDAAPTGIIDPVRTPSNPYNATGQATRPDLGTINKVHNFRYQDIKLLVPISEESWTYDVVFRSTYENMESMDVTFKVRFNNPLTVSLTDFVLETSAEPQLDRLLSHLTVGWKNGTATDNIWDPAGTAGTVNGYPGTPGAKYNTYVSNGNPSTNSYDVHPYNEWLWSFRNKDKMPYISGEDRLWLTSAPYDALHYGYQSAQHTDYVSLPDAIDTAAATGLFWQNQGGMLLEDITGGNVQVTVQAGYPPYATRTTASDGNTATENRTGNGGDIRLKNNKR